MKKTLLELTQDVLSAVDGEEVNSISDSVESLQVANDIKVVFYDLIGRKDWQFLRRLTNLNNLSDISKPTHLLLPERASAMDFIKYNKRKLGSARNFFLDVRYEYPDEFLRKVNQRDNTKANYDLVTDFDGAIITIRNDIHPTFWTSFDDKHIVMDAYDNTIETTLRGDNTQISLYITPEWSVDDGFTPELPDEMFPLLFAECTSYTQARKDDVLLKKTEQTARRQQRHLSQRHGVTQSGVRYPNYGRRGAKMGGGTNRPALFGPRS